MNLVTEHDDVLAGMHPYRCSWTGFRFIEGLGVIGFSGGARCICIGIYIQKATQVPQTCHVEEAEKLFCRIESPTTFRAKAVPDHNIQACEVLVVRFPSVCSFGRKAEVAVANRPFLQYLLKLARQLKQQPDFSENLTRNGKKDHIACIASAMSFISAAFPRSFGKSVFFVYILSLFNLWE